MRPLLVAGAIGIVMVLAWYCLPQLQFTADQRACLNHRYAPDQPVFMQRDVELLPNPDRECGVAGLEWSSVTVAPSHYPTRALATSYYVPRQYRQFLNAVPAAAQPGLQCGVLFLHRRWAPGGCERLVVVGVYPEACYGLLNANPHAPHGCDDTLQLDLWLGVYSVPRSAKAVVLRYSDAVARVNLGSVPRWQKLVLYGGTPDPADPARFTIRYAVDGRDGELEGWLRADDTVVVGEMNAREITGEVRTMRGSGQGMERGRK
jgi:hypothetical protein